MRPRLHALGLAMALALAAFATTPAPAQQDRNVMVGAFDVGPMGQQGNFNPLIATAGFTWLNMYFETLVLYDAKLETISGALAQSFEVSPDKTRYSFKLAPGVKWHDGKPLTAADVKFTIETAKDPKTASVFASRLADVSGIETPDDLTVVLTLSRPNASLLDVLTKLMILPKHALEGIPRETLAKDPWWSTAPVGTGPFVFVRYETDQYVELKANPDYRKGAPKLAGVINRYLKNTAGAVAALKAGEIQASYVEPDDARTFAGQEGFRIIEGDSYVLNYIGFNHTTPLWKDERVRRAVMLAINRDAIVKSLYGGAATVANCGYVAPRLVPSDIDPYAYDPAKAKQLLQEAGWDQINGGKPLTFLTYYNSPQAANVMAAMQAMLAQVGINVVPKQVDAATYNSIVYAKEPDSSQYPLVYAGIQDGPDPGSINVALNSKQIPPAGGNIARVDMPDVTSALDAALAEADADKRVQRFQDVCRVMNKELPWATMWVGKRYGVAATSIADFVWLPAPTGGGYAANAQAWAFK